MAGHSKWANIRFRKAAQDARRGKLFSKLIREITVAAKAAGSEPDTNPRLRGAVEKALAANMTRDVIDRAIRRGDGAQGGSGYQDVIYEGYGPGGVAMLIECSTDNKNRTVSEIRHLLSKHGGNLGTEGSVAYMFERIGVIQFAAETDEEQVIDITIPAGAEDIEMLDDGAIMVSTSAQSFDEVVETIENAGLEYDQASIEQRSSNSLEIDEEMTERIVKLIELIENLDDVQDVYTNASFAVN